MNLYRKIEVLSELGDYMRSSNPDWVEIKERAHRENNWFIPPFIELAVNNITNQFLQEGFMTRALSGCDDGHGNSLYSSIWSK